MKIIGFTGKAGSGKDSAGKAITELLEESGMKVTKLSYAGPLKDCSTLLWGWDRERLDHDFDYKEGNTLDDGTPDPACEALGMTRREFMQFFGTEAMRKNIHEDVWIIALKLAIKMGKYDQYDVGLLTDCRFMNELQFVRDMGGALVQIQRTGGVTTLTDKTEHDSELNWLKWKDWDAIIENHIEPLWSFEDNWGALQQTIQDKVLVPFLPEMYDYKFEEA